MLGCKCLRSHHVVCSASSPSFSPPDTPKLRTKKSHVQSAVSLGTFANYKLLSTSHDIDSSIIKKTSNFCISHLNVGLPESTARHQRSPTWCHEDECVMNACAMADQVLWFYICRIILILVSLRRQANSTSFAVIWYSKVQLATVNSRRH